MSWHGDRRRHSIAAREGWKKRNLRQQAKREIGEVILRRTIPGYSDYRDAEIVLSATKTYIKNRRKKRFIRL